MSAIVRLLQSITPENHDTVCDAIRDGIDEHLFATLKYEGHICTTDGQQFIQLKDAPNGLMTDDSIPVIIPIPEDGAEVQVIDESLLMKVSNVARVVATVGAPLSELAIWLRLVLIAEGRSIVDNSPALQEASDLAVSLILDMDSTGVWLMNACCHYAAQQSGKTHDEVCKSFIGLSDKEKTEFIENTSVAMGFKLAPKS